MSAVTPLVLSGSKGRLGCPILNWYPSDSIVLLVEPSEYSDYQSAHPGVDVVQLPQDNGGFAKLMNFMLQLSHERGADYFVFCDDDLLDFQYRPSLDSKFERLRGESLLAHLARLVEYARQGNLSQVAISFSGQSWGAKEAWKVGVGAWGMHITNTKMALEVGGYDESLPIFNDWDMSARLLLAGYRNVRTNLHTFRHKMKSQPGGAESVYANQKMMEQANEAMAARYGKEARVSFNEAHQQHEVRLNWRNLLARGQIRPARLLSPKLI